MAVETVDVPDLPEVVHLVRQRRNLLEVDPLAGLDVPEDGQHVDAAVRQAREVSLEAPRAERVVDFEFGAPDPDEPAAVARVHRVGASVLLEASAGREVAEHLRLVDRPRHLHVQ